MQASSHVVRDSSDVFVSSSRSWTSYSGVTCGLQDNCCCRKAREAQTDIAWLVPRLRLHRLAFCTFNDARFSTEVIIRETRCKNHKKSATTEGYATWRTGPAKVVGPTGSYLLSIYVTCRTYTQNKSKAANVILTAINMKNYFCYVTCEISPSCINFRFIPTFSNYTVR
jgi:hypothetical protein